MESPSQSQVPAQEPHKGHRGGEESRYEIMGRKKSRGLVDYSGQPTVIKNFFEILPKTEVKDSRKRARK